jgi:hypothetical protein
MGIIDHNIGKLRCQIRLSPSEWLCNLSRPGHAVDYQLNRQLSAGFHKYADGPEMSEDGRQWQTADNYWLRLQGRNDREEAAADAFAVLVMSQAGLGRPVFANQPVTTDYYGISAAAALALQTGD